jgi:hypothetical protein
MEEQELTGLSDPNTMLSEGATLPSSLSNKKDNPSSPEIAADLVREEAAETAPPEQATPAPREDASLHVESICNPEPLEIDLPPEDVLASADGAEAATLDIESTSAEQRDAAPGAVSASDLGPDLGQKALWFQGRWMPLVAGLGIAATAMFGIGSYVLRRNRNQRRSGFRATQRVARSLRQLTKG